ncbi:metallophosphoesterase family protein [Facklamia languida]
MNPIRTSHYEKAFVVGDIHGMADEFEELLEKWSPQDQQLILIGDYMDRGYANQKVLEKIWELQSQYSVITLRGNHEEMLLNFLRSPSNYFNHFVMNGAMGTLSQLTDLPEQLITKTNSRKLTRQLKRCYPRLEDWLMNLPYYIEFGEFIIVHAGIDLSLDDWHQTSDYDFLWLRDHFHHAINQTGKQIIFGHTPTMVLNQNYYNSDVWRKDGKWGIDGGAVFGGQLHALEISQSAVIDIHSVRVQEGN